MGLLPVAVARGDLGEYHGEIGFAQPRLVRRLIEKLPPPGEGIHREWQEVLQNPHHGSR